LNAQETKTEAETVPAIAITLQHELDGNRRVVLQSYISSTCTDAEFNEMFDKLSRASDRQNAKTTLPTTENLLQLKKQRLETETERYFMATQVFEQSKTRWHDDGLAQGRRNPKPTPQQAQELTRLQADVTRCESNVKVLKQEIEELELQVGMWKAKMGA
jgi:hypothetical protein